LLKNFPVVGAANFTHHLRGFLSFYRLRSDRHDIAVHTHFWLFSLSDVQIGSALPDNHA